MQPAKSEYSFQPAQATDEVAGRLSCPVQRCNAQSCPAVYRRTRWSQTVMNHLHAEHGYLQVAGFISDFMRCCYISLALIAPRATGKEQKRESSIYGNEYSRCRLWKESAFRYQIDFKLHCHRETSRVLRWGLATTFLNRSETQTSPRFILREILLDSELDPPFYVCNMWFRLLSRSLVYEVQCRREVV